MSYYIILWNFTDQGLKNRMDCLQNVEIFKGYAERMGNPFHGTYYSFGQYDAVSLLEANDDSDVRYALLHAERQGNLRATILESITHEEAVRLAESIESI